MTECHIDFEWRSDVPIARGPEQYFGSPRSEPLMASYAFTGGPVLRWLPHEPCPPTIVAHAAAGGMFVAHNTANFERHAVSMVLAPRYGWPNIPIRQWRDTMAAALAMGLPGKLEHLGQVLNLSAKKDKRGDDLIEFFCIPRKDGQFNEPKDHSEKFEIFRDYCDQDVRTEIALDGRLIPLSSSEQEVWVMDQTINDRGVRVDRASVVGAQILIERAKETFNARMRAVTGGAVKRCTEAAALTEWIATQGVHLDGVAKNDLLEALDLDDLPDIVRQAIEIRQAAAKSSTAKLGKMLTLSEGSGRIKHRFRMNGTKPGRWTALDPNVANLPRPRGVYAHAYEDEGMDINQTIEFIREGSPELLGLVYGPKLGSPIELVSDSLRGFLCAAPGHDLIAVDYSSIQGCLASWFAGEEWKLKAYAEIKADPKSVPDLYRRAAASILGLPLAEVTKKHWARQAVGKTSELALQFQGSVGALVSMAANYGIRRRQLHDLHANMWANADEESRAKATKAYERALRSRNRQFSDVLTREAWLFCSLVVAGWRATNPEIKASWTTLETAARNAVRSPGDVVTTLRGVQYVVKHGYLWCKLPSGRCICYAAPKLKDQVWARTRLLDGAWSESEVMDGEEARRMARAGEAKIEGETSPKVTILNWERAGLQLKPYRYALYGGLCMENLALGAESDILRRGMKNCEANGYPIVLHVYDEAVAEVPVGFGSIAEMETLMLDRDEWAKDLPLGAAGWRSKRYHK